MGGFRSTPCPKSPYTQLRDNYPTLYNRNRITVPNLRNPRLGYFGSLGFQAPELAASLVVVAHDSQQSPLQLLLDLWLEAGTPEPRNLQSSP